MERNRHMNVFEEYIHGEKMPLENNLTRALAISLEENDRFMDNFIKMLSDKIGDKALRVKKDYDVNIQFDLDKIIEIENIKKVYGFALTTEKYDFDEEKKRKKDQKDKKEITDLIINFEQTVIIIEAKRDASNANRQLQRQINKAIRNLKDKSIETHYAGIEWEDIFDVLRNFYLTPFRTGSRIIRDFREFIYKNLGACGKPEKLSKIEKVDDIYDVLVDNRLKDIKKEYVDIFCTNDDSKLIGRRESIPVDIPYVGECGLKYDSGNQIVFTEMYIGSTATQYRKFRSSKMANHILNLSEFEFESQRYEIEIIPYLKFFNNYGKYIKHYELYKKEVGLYKDIVGRYKINTKGDWIKNDMNLLDSIREFWHNNLVNYNRFNSFEKDFKDDVVSKVQTTVCCTVEYCLMVKIPMDEALVLDDENKIPDFVNAVIEIVTPHGL